MLTPLAFNAYQEIRWRLEVKYFTEAPSPVLLTPVGEAATGAPMPPEASEPPPAMTPETPLSTEPPPKTGPLPVLTFDRSQGIPTYQLEIPRIGVKYLVGEGIENEVLAKGPGRYPQTSLPGEMGNAALAGHRTVRGRPAFFFAINELQPGDPIHIGYRDKQLTFEVEKVFLTTPFDLSVLHPTPYQALTLTTCDPPGSDEKRLIVRARLVKVTDNPS
ncbi:MAG: sortase [Bacillota bacterium]